MSSMRYQLLASVPSVGSRDPNARVDDDRPVGEADHGVEVELRELREVVGELREPVEDIGERGGVGGAERRGSRRRAVPPCPTPTSSSASTSVSGESRKCASPISSANTPPGPNATSGPKTGSCATPGEQLDAALDHRLHDHGAADPLGRGANGLGVGEVERDAAGLRLVRARPRRS